MRPLTACCARYHGRGRGDRGSAWRSSSNKLWRKGPRREAGPRYSAGRALRGCGRFLRHLLGASNSRQRRSRHAARGHRRHTGRPRTIGRLCCPIVRKGVRYLRRCRTVGNDPDAKPACGTPRAERHAAAVVALRCYSRRVDGRGPHPHGSRTSALSPLGDWARGNPKDRSRIASIRSIELIPPAGGNGLLLPTTPSSNLKTLTLKTTQRKSTRTISSRGRNRRGRTKNSTLFQIGRLRR